MKNNFKASTVAAPKGMTAAQSKIWNTGRKHLIDEENYEEQDQEVIKQTKQVVKLLKSLNLPWVVESDVDEAYVTLKAVGRESSSQRAKSIVKNLEDVLNFLNTAANIKIVEVFGSQLEFTFTAFDKVSIYLEMGDD